MNRLNIFRVTLFVALTVASCNGEKDKEDTKFLPLGPGGMSGLMSSFEGKSDFKIRIHAPQEDTQDVLDALDSLVKIEQAERRADEDDYVTEKQRLLNIQKNRIRDITYAAFEPLQAMLPNPITTEVSKQIRDYFNPKIMGIRT